MVARLAAERIRGSMCSGAPRLCAPHHYPVTWASGCVALAARGTRCLPCGGGEWWLGRGSGSGPCSGSASGR
eukprot:105464-Alexandrium_andersonii.AAC.1